MNADLETAILRDVSRSFYLTLRLLPSELRATMSLGYLLARATDTVADSSELPAGDRRELLDRMGLAIGGEPDDGLGEALAAEVAPTCEDPREGGLLGRFPDCLAWLGSMEPGRQASVRKVLATIISGQQLDLERFGEGGGALATDEELEDYTYRVAGCVGEFWTERILDEIPQIVRGATAGQMTGWGISYGQGLQLINILRDREKDAAGGRVYLPDTRPPDAWETRCAEHLENGLSYVMALRPGRAKLASALPLLLAKMTLTKLQTASVEELANGVKVPRGEVKRLLAKSLWAVFSNRRLERLYRSC